MKRKIFYTLIAIFLLANISLGFAKTLTHLLYFYSESCHSCHKVKHEILPQIEQEFFDRLIIEYLNIADVNNYKLMLSLKEKYNCFEDGTPEIFIGGRFLVGYDKIKEGLRNTILTALEEKKAEKIDRLAGMDLVKHFLSFGVLAIVVAGLIDGINPCAFTVIVFFISFLALQGYRKKELTIIGISFILAVFFTYVGIGLGLFRFLYSLKQFYLLSKIVYYAIALLCLVLSACALYDLWLFKKTGQTEGLTLQLPQVIKNRIHAIIGLHYRKTKDEAPQSASQRHLLRLIGSAFLTGFLVSLLEAVCTGQMYLPTITFMLKEASLRLRAFGYLLLYNLMFIIPLIFVLILALLGTTAAGFSRFMQKRMVFLKLLMAILFFGLGVIILVGA